MTVERVFIVGAGAVGSALAGLLFRAGMERVVLVGRSVHWQTVRDKGLVFHTVGGEEVRLSIETATPEEMPETIPTDLVLLTGKLPDLESVASWLAPKAGPETPLIALQNGLEIRALAAAVFGREMERGLLFFGANSPEPGRVVYNRGLIRLESSAATLALAGLLEKADIKPIVVEDFRPVEWFKLAINCVANPLAGILGAHNEAIRQPVLDPAKSAILAEVVRVARAAGVELDLDADFYNQKIKGSNTPSLRTDLVRGRPTEIDHINGAVVAKGRELGVPTPVNELVVSLVKHLETVTGRS